MADALRFALGEERGGPGANHGLPSSANISLPESGELVYEIATGRLLTEHADACLVRMAACYMQSQMKRREVVAFP